MLGRLPELAAGVTGAGPIPELRGRARSVPPPFAHLWVPFVRFARERVGDGAGAAARRLGRGALAALERQLLTQLSAVAARAAYAQFDEFREAMRPSAVGDGAGARRSRRLYRAFIASTLADSMLPLFGEFAVLARHVVALVDGWTASTVEFIGRLDRDLEEIGRTFGDGRAPGRVVGVAAGLSDRHNGGRSVLALTFGGGLRIVYKPRDVGLEGALSSFLRWVAGAGLSPAPPAIRVLAREGYGWVEYVEQEPARDAAAVREYYRQAGALLFIAHLLGGRDLHMGNLVATRSGPVIVDGETTVQPVAAAVPESAAARMRAVLEGSFLGTGLLTAPAADPAGAERDIGGLCGRGRWSLGDRPCWLFPNTDAMRPGRREEFAPAGRNEVILRGEAQPPERFARELADGFSAAYELALARRDALLDPSGPLRSFDGQRTRLVLRPTALYAALQERLAAPACQRLGLDRSFTIDALNRVFRRDTARPLLWPLAAEERGALEALDVPYFAADVGDVVIVARNGEEIAGYLANSGTEALRGRVRGLDRGDLERQLELLDATVGAIAEASDDGRIEAAGRPVAGGRARRVHERAAPRPRALVATARTLAEEIRAHAIAGADGSVAWVLPVHLRPQGTAGAVLPYSLYHGVSGVALFLSGLASVTGETEWGELARAAVRQMARVLGRGAADELVRGEPIGACSGSGGVVYALACAAGLLRDEWLAGLAARVGSAIPPSAIAGDARLDVEGGAAGAALGLLTLHAVTGEVWALERAVRCGERLIAAQTPAPAGGAAWVGRDGVMAAGFAHGAAGIACALARLYRATGDERFRAAVERAHEFERTVYSPAERNWPALASAGAGSWRPVVMSAWCHGAPGIALARAEALAAGVDGKTGADLETAVAATIRSGLLETDHMCCGNVGITDIMVSVATVPGRAELMRVAAGRAQAVMERACARGGFCLQAGRHGRPVFHAGFFRGTAGIGYGLLRLARPGALPSVLALQAPPAGGG